MTSSELLDELATLERKEKSLVDELDAVRLEICRIKARHASIVNESAPVARLPPEIMGHIFLLSQRNEVDAGSNRTRSGGRSKLRVEVTLSHTSTHWRNLALANPLLWNRIVLYARKLTDGTKGQLASVRTATYLTRSAACPLDIDGVVERTDILDLICAPTNLVRWRHVRLVIFDNPDFYNYGLSLIRHAAVPLLESFLFCTPEMGPSVMTDVFTGGAPALKTVRIFKYPSFPYMRPPLCAITTLILDVDADVFESFVRETISAAPSLMHLSLRLFATDPQPELPPFHIPFLRSLRIKAPSDVVYRLLSSIRAPDLNSLILEDCVDAEATIEPPTLSWATLYLESDTPKFPRLEAITLIDCFFTYTNCQSLYRIFPNITRLSLAGHSNPEILRSLSEDGQCLSRAALPLQALHTLSIENLETAQESLLCRAVLTARKQLACPISVLRIDAALRTKLRRKGRLEWIKTVVSVESWSPPERWPPGMDVPDLQNS